MNINYCSLVLPDWLAGKGGWPSSDSLSFKGTNITAGLIRVKMYQVVFYSCSIMIRTCHRHFFGELSELCELVMQG